MSARRRALVRGVVVVLAFAAGASITAHVDPGRGGALLDGLAPPQAYRWVDPPDALAGTNKAPEQGTLDLEFQQDASVLSFPATADAQASVVMPAKAVELSEGQTGARVTIDPLSPSAVGPPPAGLEFAGNVYRVKVTTTPGGQPAPTFTASAILVYPSDALNHKPGDHTMLASADGKVWKKLEVDENPSQRQVKGRGAVPGYFAVAVPESSSSGGLWAARYLLWGLAVLVLIGGIVVALIVRRRNRSDRKADGPAE